MSDKKPTVNLVGKDGNAFSIMAACSKAAKRAGWTKERIDKVISEMMSDDYDNLLRVAMENFNVV